MTVEMNSNGLTITISEKEIFDLLKKSNEIVVPQSDFVSKNIYKGMREKTIAFIKECYVKFGKTEFNTKDISEIAYKNRIHDACGAFKGIEKLGILKITYPDGVKKTGVRVKSYQFIKTIPVY